MPRDDAAKDAAHRRSISIHCPNQDEVMMAVRVEIAKLRDRASAGIGKASPTPRDLLCRASGVAAVWVYADAEYRQLSRIAASVAMTIQAAVAMEIAGVDDR